MILHYSAPPVIGGVEAVILAHVKQFTRAGYHTIVAAGRGDEATDAGAQTQKHGNRFPLLLQSR